MEDSNFIPRQKKQKRTWNENAEKQKKKQKQSPVESLLDLPDSLLVVIGKLVAKLGTARDFVHFSLVSERLKGLLMDSEAVVSEIIRTRVEVLKSFSLPSLSASPIVIRSLEQLVFCEDCCFRGHNLLEDNRVVIPLRKSSQGSSPWSVSTDLDRILKPLSTLEIRPSDKLVVHAHCGTGLLVTSEYATKITTDLAIGARDHILETTKMSDQNCEIMPFGMRVAEIISLMHHPYHPYHPPYHPYYDIAEKHDCWLEIYFKRTFGSQGFEITLPPTPDYYRAFWAQQN